MCAGIEIDQFAKEKNGMKSNILLLADNVIHTSDKDLGAETIASVVITGISVVFIGLILLILLVWLYGKIFEKINASAKKKADEAAAKAEVKQAAAVSSPVPESKPASDDGIDEEITAVIAAAIAAYGEQTGKRLAIRSIKPAGQTGGRNAWSAAGLSEATRPF